jgi:hypothetical protein
LARKRIPVEIASAARVYAESAVRTLQAIMGQAKAPHAARVAAAIALLDRGYGRPKQSLEHGGPNGLDEIRITIRNLTNKEDK